MALRFLDSVQNYSSADMALKWSDAAGLLSTTGGRSGPQCLKNSYFAKYLDNQSTFIVGWAVQAVLAMPMTQSMLISFRDSSNHQLDIYLTSLGEIKAYRTAATTAPYLLGTSSTGVITEAGTYYYIEVKAKFHASAGTVEVRVNNVTVLSLSNVNTIGTANAYANQIYLFAGIGTGGALICDVYMLDGTGTRNNDFWGDTKVLSSTPTSDASVAWTRSTGTTNYGNVDEAPGENGDTDYNYSSNPGDTDLFGFAAISGWDPKGVQIQTVARKDDAGSRSIANLAKSGASETEGATVSINSTYMDLLTPLDVDPTGAAWTVAGFNACAFGYREKV